MLKAYAADLKEGDIVINFMGEQCVVESKRIVFGDYDMSQVFITVIDTRLAKHEYLAEDIYYPDLSGESDEEKAWVKFCNNFNLFVQAFDNISDIKFIFKQGYAKGFTDKRMYTVEEQLQK